MTTERDGQLLAIASCRGRDATIDRAELAAAAGISPDEYDRLFPDFDAMYVEMIDAVLRALSTAVDESIRAEGDPRADLFRLISALLPLADAADELLAYPNEWGAEVEPAWQAICDRIDVLYPFGWDEEAPYLPPLHEYLWEDLRQAYYDVTDQVMTLSQTAEALTAKWHARMTSR